LCRFWRALACQCGPHPRADLLRRLSLHPRHHVAIGVQGDADRGVPEALLHDLGMHALTQEHRGMSVPQVVEAAGEAGLLEDPAAGTREVGRPPRLTVGAGEDEVVTLEAGPTRRRISHCALRCSRSASTVISGRAMVRAPRAVFGSLKATPADDSSRVLMTVSPAPWLRTASC